MSIVLYSPSIRLLFVQTLVLGRAVMAIMRLLSQLKIASAGAGRARGEDSGCSGHFALCSPWAASAHPGFCSILVPWAGTGG